MVRVKFRAIEYGSRSERKTSMNERTSRSIHSICTVSIYLPLSLLVFGCEIVRKIYEDRIVEFEVQQPRYRFG